MNVSSMGMSTSPYWSDQVPSSFVWDDHYEIVELTVWHSQVNI
ncbi:hypothetical protein [Fibrella aestuarina]|nr:hypothetical protein [Fibrella aestuarina]